MRYGLGIIGAGNMAEAIVRGVVGAKVYAPTQIVAADVSQQRRDLFDKQLEVKATTSNVEAARDCDVLLLSTKPYQMADVLGEIKGVVSERTLFVSIAAGISTAKIEKLLGEAHRWRVVRAMPNTPMLLGEGMVAISAGQSASPEDLSAARKLFESAATVIEVPENKMDAVTAMSGSGPAYFYYLVELMTQAGVELGLSEREAETMARKTAMGAAKMLVGISETPAELRRKVTTPGGTTHAAISTMEERGVGQAVVAAIRRAAERSREMGA